MENCVSFSVTDETKSKKKQQQHQQQRDARKMRRNASHIHRRCFVYKFNVKMRNKREVSLNVYDVPMYISVIFLCGSRKSLTWTYLFLRCIAATRSLLIYCFLFLPCWLVGLARFPNLLATFSYFGDFFCIYSMFSLIFRVSFVFGIPQLSWPNWDWSLNLLDIFCE